MFNHTEADRVLANSIWTSTGVIGCLLNLTLFIVVLLNSKGFYRTLTLAVAAIDFCYALGGIFLATWYYMSEERLYCLDYGYSEHFPDWLYYGIWLVWGVCFFAELEIITYSFIWRAVLVSNSRMVAKFESIIAFAPILLISCGLGYYDYSLDCSVDYPELSPLDKFMFVLPATIASLHFPVIVGCGLFIDNKIKGGSFSNKMKNTHKKRLFVLCMQLHSMLVNSSFSQRFDSPHSDV